MAMEYIAKGWNALKEVDRVIDYCEPRDKRLIPHLKVTMRAYIRIFLDLFSFFFLILYWVISLS